MHPTFALVHEVLAGRHSSILIIKAKFKKLWKHLLVNLLANETNFREEIKRNNEKKLYIRLLWHTQKYSQRTMLIICDYQKKSLR